jgi:hypothetical protein
MALSEFVVSVDELGRGPVMLDGVDVAERIEGFQFTVDPATGGMPTLVLQQRTGAALIEGKGVVYVRTDAAEAPGEDDPSSVVAWLDGVDLAKLERRVLDSFSSLNPPATVPEAWIAVLRAMAEEGKQ